MADQTLSQWNKVYNKLRINPKCLVLTPLPPAPFLEFNNAMLSYARLLSEGQSVIHDYDKFFHLVFQRRNNGLQSFSKSCWAGLEKKFFWLSDQRGFFKKLKVLPSYMSKQNSVQQEPAQSTRDNQVEMDKEADIVEDVFVIRSLLEKLKLALVQVNSDVAEENEMLKRELKSLKGLIVEKQKRIRMLENILKYEKSVNINSRDVMIK